MTRRMFRVGSLALAAALALASPPSEAIAPVLLLLIKQIAQDAAKSMIKDALLSGLSGMGCKGIALANALQAFDLRSAAGGAGGMMGMRGGMPNLPAGIGLGLGGGMPPEMAAKMDALMPNAGQLPPGMALAPDQMAMMARMQQAMGQPLSPPETLATIDELFDLGFLPKAIQTEFKECMVLVPASIPALGMGMGMMKPMIPQLRQAREQVRALSPQEQDEVAAALVEQIKPLPADERASLLEYLDSGFFPLRIVAAAKEGAAAR